MNATAGSGRRSARIGCLVIAAAAGLLLLWFAPLFEPWKLDIVTLNDQVGYITTARWLADTGELRSHTIYPAYVDQPNWRLYMPGHYWCLATVFEFFGYGPLQARLPGMIGFVLTAVCVFLIGRKLYGETSGAIAAFLFLTFPPNLAYSFTAMPEPVWVAAGTAAFCAFLHLPARVGFYAVPLLVVAPFLVRETGALLLVPMAFLVYSRLTYGRASALAVTLVGSVAMLQLVSFWQQATGKMAPPISWIVRGEFNLADAVLAPSPPSYSLGVWVTSFADNVWRNLAQIAGRWVDEDILTLEPVFTAVVLVLTAASLWIGLRKRDAFAFGAGIFGTGLFLVVLVFHNAEIQVVIRHVLIAVPLLLVALSPALRSLLGPNPLGRDGRARTASLAVGVLLASHVGAFAIARQIVGEAPRATRTLEVIGHDDTKLLVTSPRIGLDYALKHYPVRWSFVPENDETLVLLDQKHEIGTLVILERDLERKRKITHAALSRMGLRRSRTFRGPGPRRKLMLVFQRRQ